MDERGRIPVLRRAALAALAATGALVLAILAFGGSDRYAMSVSFDQAHGLVTGAEVKTGGFVVGKVSSIELGNDGRPLVGLQLDDDVVLRGGATADVRPFSLAGQVNRYVDLTLGSGEPLSRGTRLDGVTGSSPVEIDQALSTLDPPTRRDVRRILDQLDEATQGRGPDIEAALALSADAVGETAELLADVRGDGDSLRELLRNTRTVVGAIARDADAPAAALADLGALLRTTAQHQTELARGLARLPAGLRSPRLALERTASAVGELRKVVADARPAISSLLPLATPLRRTLAAASPVLDQANHLATRSRADIRRLEPLLTTAAPVLRRLTPVLQTANPMLDEVRVRLPDAFAFFANWADFTANYDANGHAARIGLVFAPPPLDARGPSDTAPGHLLAPFARTPGVLEGEPWTDFADSFVGSAP